MMTAALKNELERLISDLVAGHYSALELDGRAGSIPAQALHEMIGEYGRTLVSIPEEGWGLIEEYPIGADSTEIGLDVPLWSAEEGRSDLTLLVTATRDGDDWKLQIDDLRVL